MRQATAVDGYGHLAGVMLPTVPRMPPPTLLCNVPACASSTRICHSELKRTRGTAARSSFRGISVFHSSVQRSHLCARPCAHPHL